MKRVIVVLIMLIANFLWAQPVDKHFCLNAPIESYYEAKLFLQELGVRGIKWYLSWSAMEHPKGTYYWGWTDGVMRKLHTANDSLGNISFFPSISSTPGWARGYSGNEWTPPTDKQDYADFIVALLRRYRPHGTFAQQQGWTDDFGITEIEIWNEPNLQYFWHRKGNTWTEDAHEYMEMLKITYKAVKDSFPEIKVTSGGFANWPWDQTQNIFYALPFYYEQGLKDFCDILAIHYYPGFGGSKGYDNAYSGLRQTISQIKAIMTNYGDSTKPIWNTEGGLNSAAPGEGPFTQAIYLVRFYVIQMAKGIERIYWFWSRDINPDSIAFGLVTPLPELTRKTAFYTYKKLIEKLSGCDWSVVDLDSTGSDYVRAVKTSKDGLNLWVVWWDYFNDPGYTYGDTFNLQLRNINASQIIVTSCIPYDTLGGVGFYSIDTIDVYNGKAIIQVEKNPLIIEEASIVTVSETLPHIPSNFSLLQNYPNPSNSSTTICFSLPRREHVTLKVFDVLGREIATLINGELNPGEHSVVYDTKNLPSGVYFYHLTTPTFSQTKSMEVLK